MKLKELASKLGLEIHGDGGVEIFAPAPIEAASPGMIVFVASAKYVSALQSNVSAAITTAELAAGAKCATLISANPYADFARVLEIFFPPYRPAPGIDPRASIANDAVKPNDDMKRPTMPPINPTGRKTASNDNVVAMTARPISFVPSIAAWNGGTPFSSMKRKMFSSTTIASSITMPTIKVSASIVI